MGVEVGLEFFAGSSGDVRDREISDIRRMYKFSISAKKS